MVESSEHRRERPRPGGESVAGLSLPLDLPLDLPRGLPRGPALILPLALALGLAVATPGALVAQDFPDCIYERPNTRIVETDEYAFVAQPASGAVGDVVPVTISLRSQLPDPGSPDYYFFLLSLCHDPARAELVGAPVYDSAFQELCSPIIVYTPVEEGSGQPGDPVGHGFQVLTGLHNYGSFFPSEELLPVMTVYYRIRGLAGTTSTLTFCNTLESGADRCRVNALWTDNPLSSPRATFHLSRAHQDGLLTALKGPPTQFERPPTPPEARVYDSLPSTEEIGLLLQVGSGVGAPGESEVSLKVYLRSKVEFCGMLLPIDFDERYLRLRRVESRLVGVASIQNNDDLVEGDGRNEGWGLVSAGLGLGTLRLTKTGETVHAVTLVFDVLEGASEIEATEVRVGGIERDSTTVYNPGIWVRHRQGSGASLATVQSLVPPVRLVPGTLHISRGDAPFRRGDFNASGSVDVSDAIATLSFLFVGTDDPFCRDAGDTNDDGRIDLSDAITTLGTLFAGTDLPPPPGVSEPGPDPTSDDLDCAWYPAG